MLMAVHKGDIAIDMLEDAIDLYNRKHYISSLHLAAAASELLSGLCDINGYQGAHRNVKKMLKDFHDSSPSLFSKPKDVIKRFNYSKNTIKHINNENDQFAYICAEMDSKMYIDQCLKMLLEFGVCLIKKCN